MPTLGARFPIRKLLEAIEQMSPYMVTVNFNVMVTVPWSGLYDAPDEECDPLVEVEFRFVVPLSVAESQGFSERRALPRPQAAVAPGEGSEP